MVIGGHKQTRNGISAREFCGAKSSFSRHKFVFPVFITNRNRIYYPYPAYAVRKSFYVFFPESFARLVRVWDYILYGNFHKSHSECFAKSRHNMLPPY